MPRSSDCGEREGRAPYEKFCPTAATVANYPIRARRSQLFLRGAPCEKCCHAATTVASAPQPLFFWGPRGPYEKLCPTAATVAARRILGATRVPHNNFSQQRLRQYTHSSPSQFVHLAGSGFFFTPHAFEFYLTRLLLSSAAGARAFAEPRCINARQMFPGAASCILRLAHDVSWPSSVQVCRFVILSRPASDALSLGSTGC